MIIKTIKTSNGDAIINADIIYLETGQVTIHITGSLVAGTPPVTFTHEHRVTVGAANALDGINRVNHCATCGAVKVLASVDALSPTQLRIMIQSALDTERNLVAQVLAGRADHAAVISELS